MLIEADDAWNEFYSADQVGRILRLAKVFPVTGRCYGEAMPRGPMEGAHIPRGKTARGTRGPEQVGQLFDPELNGGKQAVLRVGNAPARSGSSTSYGTRIVCQLHMR